MMAHRLVSLVAALFGAVALAGVAVAQSAPQRPVLTVYTYSSFAGKYGPAAKIKERFEAVCDCVLEWVSTESSGAMLGRLRLEGGSTKADVLLGLDVNLMAEAQATGLFQPHGQGVAALTLPTPWTDATFLPFDFAHIAFIHDVNRLPDPPRSLRALVENPNGPRIVLQDPRTSQPGLSFVLWMRQVFGDDTPAAWAKLKPRIVTFAKGWSEAYGMFLKGEADMVLSFTTSPAYHIAAEKKTNFRAAPFDEGHYFYLELAAITRASKQTELARRFMAFMLEDGFQGAIPEGNWMYPARTPAAGLPASFRDLHRPARTLQFTPEEVQARRRAFIDEWLNATSK
jgi:thiamine transport system substrate-binding protein